MKGASLQETSCLHWPTCFSGKVGGSDLIGRVCPHWRMVPGVIALAGLIIAITCALIWNSPYLTLAFIPGVIGSVYLIYLGVDYNDNKTHAANNEIQKQETLKLKDAVSKLDKFVEEILKKLESCNIDIEGLKDITRETHQETKLSFENLDGKMDLVLKLLDMEEFKKLSKDLGEQINSNIKTLDETNKQLANTKQELGYVSGQVESLKKQVEPLNKKIDILISKFDSIPNKETLNQFNMQFKETVQSLKECKIVIPSKEEEK